MRKFKRFLKDNECYEAFLENLRFNHSGKYDLAKYIQHIQGLTEPVGYVAGAFNWKMTPEGHLYWSKINELWEAEHEK